MLLGDVWNRPGLSKRDRSLVTVSVLVAMKRLAIPAAALGLATPAVSAPQQVTVTHVASQPSTPASANHFTGHAGVDGRFQAPAPAGVKYWHGAAAEIGLTHLAITEAMDGRTVDWMEKVTAEKYCR